MNRIPPTRRLSTGTLFFKKVFPPLMIAAAIVVPVLRVIQTGGLLEALPIGAALFAAYFVTRSIGAGLADEVLDGGDHLIVRKDGTELEVPLREIEAVKESRFVRNPPRVELLLKAPGPLGGVITFIPSSYSVVPFTTSEITRELSRRLEAGRR
jgi:hypothetical protein